MIEQMDLVIAWVDGNDPALKAKREQYQGKAKSQASDAVSETRFASNHEIYFNIASILKYVPFSGHIYIVADSQSPAWLNEFHAQGLCAGDKIKVIDHRELFRGYEQHLPTFNTRSIESMLWNIDGLSDYFIYLNDDFFFNADAKISDFVSDCEVEPKAKRKWIKSAQSKNKQTKPNYADVQQIVTYGHWANSFPIKAKLKYRQFLKQQIGKPIQPKHMIAQMMGADILGFKQFFEIHHYPHSVDRRILADYLQLHPEVLERQIRYKFRHVAQLNPISLMNHLKIQQRQADLRADLPIAYLKNAQGVDTFMTKLADRSIKYGCIQSLDQLDAQQQQQIYKAFLQKLGDYLPNSLKAQISAQA